MRTGDTLRIGGQDFRIAGVVAAEPDRMTGSLNVGPRVMMTRAGLDRTGLISVGSRAAERYLFALPAQNGPGVSEVRTHPEAGVSRRHHRRLSRDASDHHARAGPRHHVPEPDRLIALVIGALGVATAMHAHLQQKLDSIAVMKCLGARSAQMIRIYMAQTLMLGLGRRTDRRDRRGGGGGGVPRLHREIFPGGRGGVLGRLAGAAGHRGGVPDHAAVHGAAAAGHPRHPARR